METYSLRIMIYKFRIILDAKEDIFRDIALEASATLEDLHNVITQAFGFDGGEMASFYLSDDSWNQGEEISLFDLSDGTASVRLMSETVLSDVLDKDHTKLIYLYDFLNLWTFFVELGDIAEKEDGITYPELLYAHGVLPDSPPDRQFEADVLSESDEEDEGFDIEGYSGLDFDENWN